MGRSYFGRTAGPGYFGHPDAAAYHDHKRKADREDVILAEIERREREAAAGAAAREAAE